MYKIYAFFDLKEIDAHTLKHLEYCLPPKRREKCMRYRQDIDRKNCVVAYLLLLHGLYTDYGICNPRISYGQSGKPYLRDYPETYFNISHCPCGCVCAVSDSPIGIDIQDIRPFSWLTAKRCCSKAELDLLKHSANPASEFTKIWVMKESYLKMKGTGITTDLCAVDTTKRTDQISTFINDSCCIAAACAESFREESICLI